MYLVPGNHKHTHEQGEVSCFHALCTALSATIGTGNMAGLEQCRHDQPSDGVAQYFELTPAYRIGQRSAAR